MTYRFDHESPKGLIFMFHGLHLSSSIGAYVAKRLYDDGFTVLAFDIEGHGKSEGPKGNLRSLFDVAEDCENFVTKGLLHYPSNISTFLSGISLGGALSVMLSLKRPSFYKGMILFAPALGVNPDFEPFIRKIVRVLSCCCGGLPLKVSDAVDCSNPYYSEYIHKNPECYTGKINVRTAVALLDGMESLPLQFKNVRIPILLFQGGNDKVVSVDHSKEFIRISESEDKEFVFYQNMYHIIFEEPEIEEILDKTVKWINARI